MNRPANPQKLAVKVSTNTIILNTALSLCKLLAGLFAHSGAMLSDAVHSASDVLATIVVMIGMKLAGRESDDKHPYGHERFECVASLVLAAMLALTGFGIGLSGVKQIIAGGDALSTPGALALVAAIVSVLVKEGMYWYTRAAAKKLNSSAMLANAWHHRSDALSSVGSFAGILGARLGLPVLDPVACVLICAFILKVAWDIAFDAFRRMMDTACDEETEARMRALVQEQNDIVRVDRMRTRLFGNRVYVEIEIAADGLMSLNDSHAVAQRVHDAIEAAFPMVKHCMVHVNPAE